MRLELTRRTDLALKALRYLGDGGTRAKAAELATALDTSTGFLQQAMKPAVTAGWVESVVGPTGGYALTTTAQAISVLDVVEASEGPVENGRCVLAAAACPSPTPCALHDAWVGARAALVGVLAATPALRAPSPESASPTTPRWSAPFTLQPGSAGSTAPPSTGIPVPTTERT